MSKIIAITGKGGTGKSTFSALVIKTLLEKKAGSVLAVDADPNSTLADALGLKAEDTLSSICEETLEKKDNLPAGMTKDRYIEYRVQQSLIEKESISLLTMGRPEGPGCYCYVNNLLREMVKDLTDGYTFTVIDNEAGMEHLSRKTARKIDVLFVVSDFSAVGVRSASNIYNLACSMGIKLGNSFLIVNKVKNNNIDLLKDEIKKLNIKLADFLPFDENIEKINLDAKSVFNLSKDSEIVRKVDSIVSNKIINV